MPEDDENDFDLDLDLDLGLAPDTPPPTTPAPTPQATTPAQPVQPQRTPTPAAPEQPAPAAFRKRDPLTEQATSPAPAAPIAQQAQAVPSKFQPPRPAASPTPSPTPAAPEQPRQQSPRQAPPAQTTPPSQQKAPPTQQPTPQAQQPAPQAQQPTPPAQQPTPRAQQLAPQAEPARAPEPTAQQPGTPAQSQAPTGPMVQAKSKLPQKRSTLPPPPEATANPSGAPASKTVEQEIIQRETQPQKKRKPRKRRTQQTEPKAEKRKRPSEESNGSLLRRKLMVGIPVLAILALITFKFILPKKAKTPTLDVDKIQAEAAKKRSESSDTSTAVPKKTDDSLPPVDRSNETPDERDERAQNTLANFFGAGKKESMLEYVRQPLRVAPLMRDYYSRKPFPPDDEREFLGLKSDLQQADAIGEDFYSAEADLGGPRSHTMILEDTDKGFRVDWEYHVQYNPMDWSTFIKEAPTPPTAKPMDFRVYARIVPDYRAPFTDEQRYLGIELMTLNDTSVIVGYVQRASELGKRMQEFLAGKAEELCILRLEFPGGSKPGDSAVYIRELVNPHWIITDETTGY